MKQSFTNRELADLRLLASFAGVARLGSITRAAVELDYVPSAVSQHITALEHRLGGALLFTRKPGSRLVLTAAGRALADAADDMLAAAAVFGDAARRISDGDGVVLRVGAYGSAMSFLLPQALTALNETKPGTYIETVEIEPADGVSLIDTGELDILIAHRYLPEEQPPSGENTDSRLIGREPMLVVTSAANGPKRLADCVDADWVAGSRRDVDRQLLMRWAGQVGLHPRVSHETRDCHTAVELIVSGVAVGLLPASVVSAPHNRMRLAVLERDPGVEFPHRDVLTITRVGFQTQVGDMLLNRIADAFGRSAGRDYGKSHDTETGSLRS
jgi:DNA-binding transcriptional LysR family regulator